MKSIPNTESRVTALEAGQQALHRDVTSLGLIVKEQGNHLSNAIDKLIDSHNLSFSQLSDKINSVGKTDWTTFWTMIGTLILIIGAISTPVWITFNSIDKAMEKEDKQIERLSDFTISSIKDQTELKVRIENIENAKRDSSATR